jgi:hypothetical protein
MPQSTHATSALSLFKAIRITLLLVVLIFVGISTWLSQSRSTDWNNSLWVKIYPINADGSEASARYIGSLDEAHFSSIEAFVARETERYGKALDRPVRIELGDEVTEQPPAIVSEPGIFAIMQWSLRLRWWASGIGDQQDAIEPDVRIFVRYHTLDDDVLLENSVGLQKGMVGVVNVRASRRHQGRNNVVIAHEFLHTLGATDKYDRGSGQPLVPDGLAEPGRSPLYPQRFAEIMGGRIAYAANEAVVPKNLDFALIGTLTAREIRLAQ